MLKPIHPYLGQASSLVCVSMSFLFLHDPLSLKALQSFSPLQAQVLSLHCIASFFGSTGGGCFRSLPFFAIPCGDGAGIRTRKIGIGSAGIRTRRIGIWRGNGELCCTDVINRLGGN